MIVVFQLGVRDKYHICASSSCRLTPTLTDTSLPLNQSCRLAQERGAVGRNGVLVGDRRRIRTIRFHKFFSTLCRWLQTYVMVAIV